MFENLKEQAPDKIIELISLFAADERANKLDLGVGVYKDAAGNTPVMRSVKAAEKLLLESQDTKKYVGLLGDLSYVDAIRELVLGDTVEAGRICGAQQPGGTGAIRQLFDLIRTANKDATVWISNPSWPNHETILKHIGMKIGKYRYFDEATCGVDFAGMKADLEGAVEGDVLLLHGCCHNPTGANITDAEWAEVTEIALAKGLVPMVDIAYQGFGDGLEEDTRGLRIMAAKAPEMLVAASCSKNFGLYRDRVGASLIISKDEAATALSKANLAGLNRTNFSFPPDHGGKVVSIIMNDEALRADWAEELEGMRQDMLSLRTNLANALRLATNSDRFDFVGEHRGMFSRLGLTPEQVMQLRTDHAIYMVGDSRINIAGLPREGLDSFARAIATVI